MYCNEDTAVFLAALALQAEFGDYMPEVKHQCFSGLEGYLLSSKHTNIHWNYTGFLLVILAALSRCMEGIIFKPSTTYQKE